MAVNKYNYTNDMKSKVIDMDTIQPLIRAIYQDRILEDPTLDENFLDTTFFDNSAIDFGTFDKSIALGQVLTFYKRRDVKPLDNVAVDNLTYKTGITCGGQLELACSIPCGGEAPTFEPDEFRLSKRYAAMAQHCLVTERFMTEVDFMEQFRKSVEDQKFVYALDVWNKLVGDGIATKQATVDPRLVNAKAPFAGKLAKHFWDLSTIAADQQIAAVNAAYRYMTSNFKGSFEVFGTTELAQNIDMAIAQSGFFNSTGNVLSGITLGSVYHGMITPKVLPAQLSGVKLNIIPSGQNFYKEGKNFHPLYSEDDQSMYVVIASRDAFAHHTIDGGIYKTGGNDCTNMVEKITQLWYAGMKTVFPEKVLVIKLAVPAFSLDSFNFCCGEKAAAPVAG